MQIVRYIVTVLLIVFEITEVEAQVNSIYSNSVKIMTGDFLIPKTARSIGANPYNQAGIYYERKIYKTGKLLWGIRNG